MSATDLRPPPVASASGGWTPTTGDLRATVYGPAVVGTLQVTDPRAIASLAALRVPEIPRPPPIAAPPLGLIVSTIALIQILAARPRRRGEAVAVLGVAASVIALAAALAVALGTR